MARSKSLAFYNTGVWSLASGTSLEVAATLLIGVSGGSTITTDGTLTIGTGSTITTDGANYVGYYAGDNATLTVSGGGVLDDIAPGNTVGNSLLVIGYSAASGTLAAATGNVVVTGTGSLIDLGLNGFSLGGAGGGNGAMTVSQGGSVIAATLNSNVLTPMAIGSHGNGTLTVTDAGSQVTAVGEPFVGSAGTGTLTVESGASFLVEPDETGLAGLIVGVGRPSSTGGLGIATVTSGGVLIDEGYLTVGESGTQGELTVSDGGTIEVGTSLLVGNTNTIAIGETYAGNGTLTIGAGSTVELTGSPSTTSYEVVIGDAGSGIGPTNLGTGDVALSGAGALLNTNGNGMAVGYLTNGTLDIGQGATVETGTPNSADISALAVGRQGDGSAVINGGSLLANGDVYFGATGTGDLLVENDGNVSVGLDGTGSINGAHLEIGGKSTFGSAIYRVGGTGSMEVNSDGTVSSQLPIIVGGEGVNGDVSINSGGVVEFTQPVLIGNSATFTAGDSILSASGTTVVTFTTVEAGDGTVDIGPGGTLAISYDGTVISAGTTSLAGNALTAGTDAGSVGTVMVSGAGALLTAASAVHIGEAGQGILEVDDGGALQITNTAIGNLDLGGSGNGPEGGAGTVTVECSGSIEADANLFVWADSTLSVDASSGIDVGTSGTYVAGAVDIESDDGLYGEGLVAAAVVNSGMIEALGSIGPDASAPGTLEIGGSVTGAGLLAVADGGTLRLDAGLAPDGQVLFAAGGDEALILPGTVTSIVNTASSFILQAGASIVGTIDPAGGTSDVSLLAVPIDNAANTELLLFEATVSQVAGTITVTPSADATVPLSELFADPSIAPGGTIATFILDGPGTLEATGSSAVDNLLVEAGANLVLQSATVITDPVTVYANGNISGYGTITGAITNNGTISAVGGTLEVTGSVSGSGLLELASGSTLKLDAAPGPDQQIVFAAGGDETLILGTTLVEDQESVLPGGDTIISPQGFDAGTQASGASAVTVTGTGSLLDNTGEFVVGDAGLGGLSIESGGTIITTPGTLAAVPAAIIANTTSAAGSSVNVTGAGSDWQITGTLIVGNAAEGLLNIASGGTVTAASLVAAAQSGGDGVITVAGTNSLLQLTGSLTLGAQGAGELSILSGATASALDLTIGGTPALSSGNVDVEGAGSELSIGTGGNLNIGVASGGSGVLTIGTAAVLNFAGIPVESGHASFNNYGTVDPDGFEYTTDSNGNAGLNLYDLYIGNIGAVQVSAGTSTWFTPMVLTGTSVADATEQHRQRRCRRVAAQQRRHAGVQRQHGGCRPGDRVRGRHRHAGDRPAGGRRGAGDQRGDADGGGRGAEPAPGGRVCRGDLGLPGGRPDPVRQPGGEFGQHRRRQHAGAVRRRGHAAGRADVLQQGRHAAAGVAAGWRPRRRRWSALPPGRGC